jgi:DnaJ-related protein SCJ1
LPLRDFYNGADREISVERQQICEECEGSGSEDGAVETCGSCGGRGVKIVKHMLAPGIFQQMQTACDVCQGKGTTILKPCKVCQGHKVVRKVAKHSLHIEKGCPHSHRLVIENEADESPEWVAGDLILHLIEQEAKLGASDEERTDGTFFRRKGPDLFWKEVLSLREAWMGDWTRNLTHLDGHVVSLSRKRGEVIQPGQVEAIEGEGMPSFDTEKGGKLLIEYTVVVPDQMEKGMEKEFWAVWEKWRKKTGVNLGKDSGRPTHHGQGNGKDEL